MTLRHLKIFVSVYQNRGFTRAGQELHLAQPSVSLAIRELEAYYGVRLFERIGRRIYPTVQGEDFYGYAIHIVSLFDEMEKKVRNWDTLGTLRIGTSITIGTRILPRLLKEFSAQFPQTETRAVICNSAAIEQQLLDSRIDLGLIETRPEHPELLSEPFMQDSLCAVLPSGHVLAARKAVTLSELSAYPFFMREEGSAVREVLKARLSLEQLSVQPAWESTSTQAIVQGVAAGLGVSVLPLLMVRKDITEGTVQGLPLDPPLNRELHVVYHKSKYLTANMQAFIRLCREQWEEPEKKS
ncbi:LysR family transcriptional regulator [Candidatus Bariatricus faecipullorum]